MKKIFQFFLLIILAVMALFCVPSPRWAAAEVQTEVIDVGNKFCPVSGDKVSGKHFTAYEGKRYAFCCPVCGKKFLKNPEKYIAKMAEQEKSPPGEAEKEGDHDHDHDME